MHSENVLFTFICSVFHFQHKAVSYGPTAVSSDLYTDILLETSPSWQHECVHAKAPHTLQAFTDLLENGEHAE